MPLTLYAIHEYWRSLDCAKLPPNVMLQTHSSWASVYNATFKLYMQMRRNGVLTDKESSALLNRMMLHAING